jgi:hypothetical protein
MADSRSVLIAARINALRVRAWRCQAVFVWHAHCMPDNGCSVVNPRDAIPGIATGEITRRPSRYEKTRAARRGSRKNCLLYGSHRLPHASTEADQGFAHDMGGLLMALSTIGFCD